LSFLDLVKKGEKEGRLWGVIEENADINHKGVPVERSKSNRGTTRKIG